jgi:multiple antibiotic resistance protein
MDCSMPLFSLSLVLFLIMDPLGNMHSFLDYLEGLNPKKQTYIILREMVMALIAILLFNFLGEYLFNLLEISDTTVYLASGVILFLVATKILFPKPENIDVKKPSGEPFLVPLAIPMIAGPALLATVMLYADTEPTGYTMLKAIFIAWSSCCLLLVLSRKIVSLIGRGGLTACEKLMGMILILLSVQRILQGMILFYSDAFPNH